jgi:hypothetical protein
MKSLRGKEEKQFQTILISIPPVPVLHRALHLGSLYSADRVQNRN